MESEKIKCLYADKNLGTTVSRNKALNNLGLCDFVCILDSATEIKDKKGLEDIMKFLEDNLDCGIIGPQLKNADEVLQYSARNLPSKKEKFYKGLPFKSAKINALQLEHVVYNLMPDFSV